VAIPKTGKKREELVTTRLILVSLSIYADMETGQCFPSVKSLARRGMCDTRTVQRHLNKLEDLGLVSRHERRAKNGAQQTTRYTLNVSPLADLNESEGGDLAESRIPDTRPSPRPRPKGVTGEGDAAKPVEQPAPKTTIPTSSINPFMNSPRKRPAARKRPGGEIKREVTPSRSSFPSEQVPARSTARENGKEGGDTTATERERFSPEALRQYEWLRRRG
jgi:DNA-binding transcriptional ArsR family regulator